VAIDFPAYPSLNQIYTFGSRTWKWNGVGWAAAYLESQPPVQ